MTDTTNADADSARTCGLGCELPEGHEGLHDDLLGGKWDGDA